MITLAIIDFFLDLGSSAILYFMGNLFTTFNSLTSYVTAFAIPQTILDIYSLATYFLPLTTISILLTFTVTIILAKTFISLVHFLPGLIFGS